MASDPFGQVSRRFEGSYFGTNHGGETARMPDSPSTTTSRTSAAVRAVLLTSPDVRRAVRNLVSARFPRVSVLAYEELPPELPVRPVGRVALAA